MADMSDVGAKLAKSLATSAVKEVENMKDPLEQPTERVKNAATSKLKDKVMNPIKKMMQPMTDKLKSAFNPITEPIKKLRKKALKAVKKLQAKFANRADETATKAAQAATRAAGKGLSVVTLGASDAIAEGAAKAQGVALEMRKDHRNRNAERGDSPTDDIGEKLKGIATKQGLGSLAIAGGDKGTEQNKLVDTLTRNLPGGSIR